jgi:steroid 5-alpha reductase family enzyme
MIQGDAVAYSAGVIAACVTALWLLSLRLRDASIADIWWGPGFAVIAWTASEAPLEANLRYGATLVLMTVWALRLGSHLWIRNGGKPEDRRYQAMRAATPGFPMVSLFQVFWLQGALQILVALPLFAIAASEAPLSWVDAIGLSLILDGVLLEAVADIQLKRFKADPASAGKVMDRGIWGWSRHPNYFGNAVLWTGVGVVGVGASAPLWALLGPATMWFLLLRVSGVTMLESTIVDRRPKYRSYMERVPSFFPRPPKP